MSQVIRAVVARLKPRLGLAAEAATNSTPVYGQRRAASSLALVVAGMLLVVPRLAAQEASPYVPLEHWTMPYAEHLIERGVIPDPTPLTRPLKRADLVRVLRAVDTLIVSDQEARTVRRLVAALEPEEHG